MPFRTRFLAVLLIVQAAVLWHLSHQPLSPLGLVCWVVALYTVGWQLYSLFELLVSPRSSARARE